MDQGALIELVRQYSHIYDKGHPDFKNKLAKENAWKTISEIMGYSKEEVETSWVSLRNRFVTERRKLRNVPTGSAALPVWRWYKDMTFLEDFVKIRKTEGNISEKCPAWNTSLTEPSTSGQVPQEIVLHTPMEITAHEEQPVEEESQEAELPQQKASKVHSENIYDMKKMKKRKAAEPSSLEKTITSALSSIENVFKTTEDEDEDLLFGKSVALSLKHIKDRKVKARAKIDILEVIERYDS